MSFTIELNWSDFLRSSVSYLTEPSPNSVVEVSDPVHVYFSRTLGEVLGEGPRVSVSGSSRRTSTRGDIVPLTLGCLPSGPRPSLPHPRGHIVGGYVWFDVSVFVIQVVVSVVLESQTGFRSRRVGTGRWDQEVD